MKILMSNIGYARGIDGRLKSHISRGHRYLYCTPKAQKAALEQVKTIIQQEDPDICCLIEIDKGSTNSGNFNQLEHLLQDHYKYFHIENKYRPNTWRSNFQFSRGKSNAFLSKHEFPYRTLHFSRGTKTLVFRIELPDRITLFFAHFSLRKPVRALQIREMRKWAEDCPGDVIVMGDFNIRTGLDELEPLTDGGMFLLMNSPDTPTFTFYRFTMLLDVSLGTKRVAEKASVKIIPQPFSDHAALLLEL
jgi:endonuclease/exonuclease/phosphatase family metal-dependent hydrolase